MWYGDDNSGALVNDENEVYGQLLTAAGAEVGDNDFRLSDMGPEGSTLYGPFTVSAAHNPLDNLYLIVFDSDDNLGEQTNQSFEIYGQMFQEPFELFLPMLVR